ncbi:hypothetical protein T11_17348 [Trichinella zimbabwensis]|uniref:Uncharacterized protein n=1 Tax=Trichinella zimbabwensis TaxID=268475 RepID=A0A0V1DQN1_9BILA|nr:hypothetical protein T11_17348 [Trichinella zimbabwensis]
MWLHTFCSGTDNHKVYMAPYATTSDYEHPVTHSLQPYL